MSRTSQDKGEGDATRTRPLLNVPLGRPGTVNIPVRFRTPSLAFNAVFFYAATLAALATADRDASDHAIVELLGAHKRTPDGDLYDLTFFTRRKGMPAEEAEAALQSFLERRIREEEHRTGIRLLAEEEEED